jgi:hypothetical protein
MNSFEECFVPNYGNASAGNPRPAFSLDMTDDALVTFVPSTTSDALSFTDVGYMPITPATLAASPLHLPAWADGAFISYTGHGLRQVDATTGAQKATYSDLIYSMIAFKGDANFGHDPAGNPIVSGVSKEAVFAQGVLDTMSGENFLSIVDKQFDIAGVVHTTLQVGGKTVGTLDLTVNHTGSTDVQQLSTGALVLSGGMLHADYMPIG